jgi:hypothetical protein
MEHLWEAKLLEEASHLLILLSYLCELGLDDLLENHLELVLHGSDSGRHDVAQLLVKRWFLVNFVVHLKQVNEVLGVRLLKL